MKLSYTFATPDTRSDNMLAIRGDMEPTFQQLSEFGYEAVELMVREADELDPQLIRKTCQNTGMEISAISTGQLRAEDGLNLSDLDNANRKKAVERTKDIIEMAGFFGVQVNIGTLRGHLPKDGPEKAKAAMAESLNELLPFAQKYDVSIALEPQNRFTINWLNNVPETLHWTAQFQHPNLKLVFDVYHWLFEEQSIYASLIRSWHMIGHIQFSDSNRGIPGTGQINFVELINVLKAFDYRGFISIEALQVPDSFTVAQKSAAFLLPLIKN
jgi:5-keto-L-gluconate epimerase